MTPIKSIALICIVILLVAVGGLFYLFLKIIKNRAEPAFKEVLPDLPKDKKIEIDDLVKFASDSTINKNELFTLVRIFTEQMSIPSKNGDKAPKEAGNYLNFITLVCRHKNVDAKLISYLNNETKKKNPTYVLEIEEYEKRGLDTRKVRK